MSEFTVEFLDELGQRLRDTDPPAEADRRLYVDYREQYGKALSQVDAVLRELARRDLPPSFRETATRLKALDSVLSKLRRKPNPLSEMQDIAGCRLTVPASMDVTHISHLLTDEFQTIHEKDYTEHSRAGYRAYHLILRTDDNYLVEVQLRTEIQHAWANLSETLAYAIDRRIKSGGGPTELRLRLEDLSDQGRLIDETLDWVQISTGAFAQMGDVLRDREAGDWIIHHQLHVVEDIQSLLRVALHLHRDLVEGFHWQLEDFASDRGEGAS